LFPVALALIPFIGSPTAIQAEGNDKFNNAPVGAGPYILKSWTRDSEMVLVRNPNYWNAPLPYVDQLILKPITDETQRINTFCAGGATMTYVGSVLNADQMQKQNCGTINPLVLNGGTVLFFNTTKPPMNDPVLRKAIGEALDPVDYSKVVTNNLIAPTKSIFRPDSPFNDPNILQPAFNSSDAQKLFDQAAATAGVGTINIPMGTFPVTNYQATAQYVQGKINSYNHVHIDLTTEASAAHITNCTQRQYTGICVFGNIFDDPDPTWTGQFTCTAATNPTGYCNAKFDADVADNEVTLDPNQRINDLKDAQKQFYSDLPALFMEQRYSWVFTNPSIHDFHFVNDGLPLLDRFWMKSH
jgi:peptide/nickel transport system substrate-binding protein